MREDDNEEMKKEWFQNILRARVDELCNETGVSYYTLSYRSLIPMTTLMHIADGTTKNPGIYTILKICEGFGITLKEFFDTEEFENLIKEYE